MKINSYTLGFLTDGTEIKGFSVEHGEHSFSVMNYGATLTSLCTPDKNGKSESIILGLSTFNEYINNSTYNGAIVGRVANRIRDGIFNFNGKTYALDKNECGITCLHGGYTSYSDTVWQSESFCQDNTAGVIFSRQSPSGEQGFSGNLDIKVIYSFSIENGKIKFLIDIHAISDEDTPVNLINHAYFNLAGNANHDILSTKMQLNSESLVELNMKNGIPTGKIIDIKGTEFDFTSKKSFRTSIEQAKSRNSGYSIKDRNYIFDDCFVVAGDGLRKFAEFEDEISGRKMAVYSNQSCVQIYTPFYEKSKPFIGRKGTVKSGLSAFCFETSGYVDALNNSNFPSVILNKGCEYHSKNVFEF